MALRRVVIEAVTAAQMRLPYNTQGDGGDWFYDRDGDLRVRVIGADLDADPETFLYVLHELVEAVLCKREGVPQAAVDSFDRRMQGADGEPGDHPDCPYRSQHRRAMLIEHQMAWFMGLSDYGTVE